jgi:hypothetical protein
VLAEIREPCILMECDSDEIWTGPQIRSIVRMFDEWPTATCARFYCRFFLGPNIVAVGENCYGTNRGEWLRAWRYEPGMTFNTHEPPFLIGANGIGEVSVSREHTRSLGLVFDHFAYVTKAQLRLKEKYYQYPDAVKHWMRLQAHLGPWPVKLKEFLPWVDDRAQADLLHKP